MAKSNAEPAELLNKPINMPESVKAALERMPSVDGGNHARGISTPIDNRALLNATEREIDQGYYTSVEGRSHVAKAGDTISGLVGSSDPQSIGNFMRANGLNTSAIQSGSNYFIPADANAYGNAGSLGQSALNADNNNAEARANRAYVDYMNRDDPELRAYIASAFKSGAQAQVTQAGIDGNGYQPFSKQYGDMQAAWGDYKTELRDGNENAAIAGRGGVMTAAVAFTEGPRELGFKLADAGLAFGGLAASVYDSFNEGTAVDDAKKYFGGAAKTFGQAMVGMDTVRLSGSYGDTKFMVGTDRVGFQYKGTGGIDEVGRLTYAWGADGPQLETVLEKNLFKIPVVPAANVYGVPIKVDLVPGLRQNLSGSRQVTPSANIDIGIKDTPVKFSIEFRKSGS